MLAEENRRRLRSIIFFIISLMLLLMYVSLKISLSLAVTAGSEPPSIVARQVVYWASLVLIFFGIFEHSSAIKCKSLVAEAQEDREPER